MSIPCCYLLLNRKKTQTSKVVSRTSFNCLYNTVKLEALMNKDHITIHCYIVYDGSLHLTF